MGCKLSHLITPRRLYNNKFLELTQQLRMSKSRKDKGQELTEHKLYSKCKYIFYRCEWPYLFILKDSFELKVN